MDILPSSYPVIASEKVYHVVYMQWDWPPHGDLEHPVKVTYLTLGHCVYC